MNINKIETWCIGMVCFSMALLVAHMVIDRFEVLPCKYTLADIPPGFEIVHNNGVYRARFAESAVVLDPYNDSDISLCKAIYRARSQHEFGEKLRQDRNIKWEIMK